MTALHWIALAIVALAASLILGSNIALGVSAALLAAFVFALVTSRPVSASLQGTRSTGPTLIEVGGTAVTKVSVQAGGPFRLRWLHIKDRIPKDCAADKPFERLVFGGSSLDATFVTPLRFGQRGEYRLGPVDVSHGDILGLRVAKDEIPATDTVLVHPRVLPMPDIQLASTRPLGDRRADPRSYEDATRPAGSRPYVHGDPMKRIHWPATARTGALVSKVYDGSSNPIYFVVLNGCADDYSEPERFELACTATASVVGLLARTGREVGLATGDVLKPDEGSLHLEHCLAALARAKQNLLPLNEQLLKVRMDLPWRSTLILVTERLDPVAAASLEIMKRAGYAVAAVVIGDPIETQGAIGRVAAIGGSVARIEKEEDLAKARFVGVG